MVAINNSLNAEDDEYGAILFISHHLENVEDSYWIKHTGIQNPSKHKIFEILVLKSHWGKDGEDGIEVFDFTLPDKITNYVISVHFDGQGNVDDITMES